MTEADAAIVNAATMELGATVCTARVPHCEICPIALRVRLARGRLPRHRRHPTPAGAL